MNKKIRRENTLEQLTQDILKLKDIIDEKVSEDFLELGYMLGKAKEFVKRSKGLSWCQYCEKEINYSKRHADRLIRISEVFMERKELHNLGINKLNSLLTIKDKKLREDFIMKNNLKEMTTKEIENAIKNEFGTLSKNPIEGKQRQVISRFIERSLIIRSQGKCEICKWGGYGLENVLIKHHIKKHSETQDDSLNNLLMVCPNCHGIIHTLENCNDKIIKENILNGIDNKIKNNIIRYVERL